MRHTDTIAADLIEESARWMQPAPEFVLDLSDTGKVAWTSPIHATSLHASYDVRRQDVLLFGPNHLVGSDGKWTCETMSRPGQHIAHYNSPAYQHIYKGAKPTVRPVIDGSAYEFSLQDVDDSDICPLDGDVFLATPLEPDNWGRWLSTVLPKVVYYKKHRLNASMQVLCRAAKPWQRALLSALDIDDHDVIDHNPGRTYFCPSLRTITYSAADLTPTAGERDIYAMLGHRFSTPARRPTMLYVSRLARAAAAPRYRVLMNEQALVERLEAIGFEAVSPELHSFQDQVRMFSAAEMVVGLGGAGMFNVLFCRAGTKVVTIESSAAFINDHSRLFAACGLRYGVIFGRQDLDDPAPVHKRWTVDVDRTVSAIEAFQG